VLPKPDKLISYRHGARGARQLAEVGIGPTCLVVNMRGDLGGEAHARYGFALDARQRIIGEGGDVALRIGLRGQPSTCIVDASGKKSAAE
jgi:hypothetical protein